MEKLRYSDIPSNIKREFDEEFNKNDDNHNPSFTVEGFFKKRGIELINEDTVQSEAVPSDTPENTELGKSKNLLKALKYSLHSSKLDGLLYGVESKRPDIAVNYSPEQLDEIAERSKRLKKMSKSAVSNALGSSLLNEMGYPSSLESPEELDEVSNRFYEDFTGPENSKKRASIRRKLNNHLKNSR